MAERNIKVGAYKMNMSEKEYIAFRNFVDTRPQGPWVKESVDKFGDRVTEEQMWSVYKKLNNLNY